MSPIPSVATASAFSSATPSAALASDSAGKSASVMSQHLLGTGGFLFAVVALFSLAGYFYHGRGAANGARTSNTWTSLTSLLSSMCPWGSGTPSTAAATDLPVDLEIGFERHASMVYARYFHPTFWNLVECHPATTSAPAIYVEEEANEIAVADPKLRGMNSFLDIDDDDEGDRDDSIKHGCRKLDRNELPPYNTSSRTSVNFSSEIIGTTVRPGTFLSVPGELEDDPSDSDLDFPCLPYDGIVTTDSESDLSCLPYDGIATTPPRSSFNTRRHGVADMAYFSQSLRNTVLEEGHDSVPTISPRTGLTDLSNLVDSEAHPTLSCGPLDRLGAVDDEGTNCDMAVHDIHDGFGDNSSDANTAAAPHEGVDLMRRLLAELRDPTTDCTPRPLSGDDDSEYYGDDEMGEIVAHFTPTLFVHNARRNSLESTFTPGTDSDASDEGSIYPVTPPSKPAVPLAGAPDVHKDRMCSPVVASFNEEMLFMSRTSSDSSPVLPATAYVRSHRRSHSLYGPRVLVARLPCH